MTRQRDRAEALVEARRGNSAFSVENILRTAAEDPASPLRQITLRELLLAQAPVIRKGREVDLYSAHDVSKILARLADRVDVTVKEPTVGWLLDARTSGRRYRAWLDALDPKVSPGFPFFVG